MRMVRSQVVRCVAVMVALASAGMVLTTSPAAGADPLASATVIINRPPVDSLLSVCITSHTLDPSGTCLRIGSLQPAVTGTMTGTVQFDYFGGVANVALAFAGLAGGPGLTANFYAQATGIFLPVGTGVYDPFPFAYQSADGTGTCITAGSSLSPFVFGISWTAGAMWGQLQCTGTFAGHSGPFNVDFAGTEMSTPSPNQTVHLQGAWAVVFGT